MFWEKLLVVLLALGMIFWVFTLIKRSPGSFSWQNINKSLTTLGFLALILMAAIAVMIWIVKA